MVRKQRTFKTKTGFYTEVTWDSCQECPRYWRNVEKGGCHGMTLPENDSLTCPHLNPKRHTK